MPAMDFSFSVNYIYSSMDMDRKERLNSNREILLVLADMVEKLPELRFHQLLWCLKVEDGNDKFYEESSDTLIALNYRIDELHDLL